MDTLSYAQKRFWLLDRLMTEPGAYNIRLAFDVRGEIDREALIAAVSDVIERHEILRTVYPEVDGEPTARVLDAGSIPAPVASVPCAGDADALVVGEAWKDFDLAREAPLRVCLFPVGERRTVLLLVMHHIAGDGQSVGPLLKDLAAAYAARGAGCSPTWEELPVQYADYAIWQREVLGAESEPGSLFARGLAYWQDTLAGMPDQLDLPVDRPRTAETSHRGDLVELQVLPETHERLAELARANRASLFMVLQAALATLCTRLGAGEDIPVGTSTAGRDDEALDALVGAFTNSLVLRTDTSGNPAFEDLLGRVRATDLAAYQYQEIPFSRVVERLNPPRVPGRNPLFQILLELHDRSGEEPLALPGLQVRDWPLTHRAAKTDLSFIAFEKRAGGRRAGLDLVIEYSTALFDEQTAATLGQRFVRVLDAVARAPRSAISSIDILSAEERRAYTEQGRLTAARYPDATVAELFERAVLADPDAVALRSTDGTTTFGELNAAANRLARQLRDLGVRAESRVAVCLENSPELIVALLAVLKAGGGYVPLDPAHPGLRLAYVLENAAAELVLTGSGLLDRLPAGTRVPAVCLDRIGDELARQRPENLGRTHEPENLVYAMYTSGSTGRPKGVLVTHSGLVNYLWWARSCYGLAGTDGAVMLGSIAFDLSVPNFFLPLIGGRSVTFLPPDEDLSALAALLDGSRDFSLLKITPGHLDMLHAILPDRAQLRSVRTYVVGADELRPETAASWLATVPGSRVINEYGPTETVVGCSVQEIDSGFDQTAPVPIGRPIANTTMYVLDDQLNPLPAGVVGELYIGGDGVARGYLGRFGLTSQRFVADPFGAPGARMYRTGDLARLRRDGALDFLGRRDSQVKVRGYRVELGEIEACLLQHPQLREAVATASNGQLVAHVVGAAGTAPDPAEIRSRLRESLPSYLVPSSITVLDRMPLTPAGKIDRTALCQARTEGQAGAEAAHTAPGGARSRARTPAEAAVCELVGDLLQVSAAPEDNFFALGGHSLLAARLAGELRTRFGAAASLGTVFSAPTLSDLAASIKAGGTSGAGGGTSAGVLRPLRPSGGGIALFCVHPGDGASWPYAELARHLDPEIAVYGLDARGQDPADVLPASIEEMAADYIQQIRTVRPTGPYRLAGWCFGGAVAYEMACQLSDLGERVDLLCLLAPHPMGWQQGTQPPTAADTYRGIVTDYGGPAPPSDVEVRAADAEAALAGNDALVGRFSPQQLPGMVRIQVNEDRIEWHYRPRRRGYAGATVLVASAIDSAGGPDSLVRSWSDYTTGPIVAETLDVATNDLLTTECSPRVGQIIDRALRSQG